MKSAPKSDEFKSLGHRFCQPKGRLHGLRATREKLDAGQRLRQHRGQQAQEFHARLRREASVGQFFKLLLQRPDIVGVAMADAAHADPRNKVDILLSVFIRKDLIAALGEGNPGVMRNALKARRNVLLLLLKNLPRL